MTRSRIVRALLAVAGAGLLVVSAASVAAAAPAKPAPAAPSAAGSAPIGPAVTAAAPAGCTAGNLCIWADPGAVDGPGQLSGNNASWFVLPHPSCSTKGTAGPVWADCASSIFNNGVNCTAHVYLFASFGLPKLDLPRGTLDASREGLARLFSFQGTTGRMTLLPYLWNEEAGLVTVWNDNGAGGGQADGDRGLHLW